LAEGEAVTRDYYAQVAAAFDRAAGSYGADYAANPIMAWLEDDTFARLCALFPAGSRVLEIGCGTGEMALRLAAAGREVVATDISPAMIEAARRAAEGRPGATRVTWRVAAAGQLTQLAPGPLAGAYSNFGPLNCEPDLAQVSRSLAQLLPPRAPLLCSVMNRWCGWELALGFLRLRPREATRRLGKGWRTARMSAAAGQPPSEIPVRYFTPGEFASHFRPSFRLETCLGYPVIVPPPYTAARWPEAVRRLGSVDRRVRAWPGLRSLGDHFLVALRRVDSHAV
jgi:SAM-dependent methyltransferase